MKILIDNALSPKLELLLKSKGVDAVHVRSLGLSMATDKAIFDRAKTDQRIVLSADTDFGTLWMFSESAKPSVVLLRMSSHRRVEKILEILLNNLPALEADLEDGAIAVIDENQIRIKRFVEKK